MVDGMARNYRERWSKRFQTRSKTVPVHLIISGQLVTRIEGEYTLCSSFTVHTSICQDLAQPFLDSMSYPTAQLGGFGTLTVNVMLLAH